MKWRYVAVRVLSFVAGAAGIVLLTFVVFPWLQGRNEPVHQLMWSDAVSEEAFGSFGEEAGADGETERQAMERKEVVIVPLPRFPVADDSRGPSLGMEAPPVAAPEEWGTPPARGDGFQQTLSPQELEVVVLELRRPAAVSDVEVDDGQAPMDRLPEQAGAVEEPSSAPVRTGAMDVAASIPGEPVPAEPARDAQPLPMEAFRHSETAWRSSGTGTRRLEFEMPGYVRSVETRPGAGDVPHGAETTAPVGPLSEFSPRQFSRSVLPATGVREPSAGSAEGGDERQGGPLLVPDTLRGVMGYRLPLISRQELPDQVVSGVLIPAHTTYVILKPGYWELVGLSPDEARAMRAAADKATEGELSADSGPVARSWNPFRLFRTKRPPDVKN